MKQYQELLKHVLENGEPTEDRTGVGTLSVFGAQARYDLRKGFPAVTTKKLFLKGVIHELLWFLQGSTNIGYLRDNNINIWNEWADSEGNLGPVYGRQWRHWSKGAIHGVDQIAGLITNLRENPTSRRHIVSAWNVSELDQMKLPPCHVMFQMNVNSKQELSCQLYQRSADLFLGVPFNIASYAILTHMIAQVCDLKVGEFIHTIGDAHIYRNHIDQCMLQLEREPHSLPQLWLNPEVKDINEFKFEDIRLDNYTSHPSIKGEIAV